MICCCCGRLYRNVQSFCCIKVGKVEKCIRNWFGKLGDRVQICAESIGFTRGFMDILDVGGMNNGEIK